MSIAPIPRPVWLRAEHVGETQHTICARWPDGGFTWWDEADHQWHALTPQSRPRRYIREHAQAIALALRQWYGLELLAPAGPLHHEPQQELIPL